MKTIALFNNKGGVGKTTLAYHLAAMLPRLGYPTVAVDLDPQANLTSSFFDEEALEKLWKDETFTIRAAIDPILEGVGDLRLVDPIEVGDGQWLVAGDLGLSLFEDRLSEAWPKCLAGDRPALRTTSAFYRLLEHVAKTTDAAVALVDVGPNLGAINRAALLSADLLLVPLSADLFSLQGLKNLGPTVRHWRELWGRVLSLIKGIDFRLPTANLAPLGYVVSQPAIRLDRPARHYAKWIARIPAAYREALEIGTQAARRKDPKGEEDPNCLATLRNYRSLMPMAQDARRPMFDLRPADGAVGSHAALVERCREDYEGLALRIAERASLIRMR